MKTLLLQFLSVQKCPVWVPCTPDDLSEQLAAAEVINLKNFDPLLTENDVPGSILPYPINEKEVKVKDLVRWLKCRGAPTANLTKSELIDRVNIRMTNNSRHMIDPSIDEYKWYNMKKKALEDENPTVKPPFLPVLGWGAFPSVHIPELFNWGHAHVYLIETAPNWTTAFDFSDDEEECFSQDMADNVGQTNIPNKGKRFLYSDHILQVMDCQNKEFYFVKARIQASMVCKTYFTSVTIRKISGSVRDSTCFCKQRSLGRCSHVAALLMYITRHTEELGYAAMSCTDRPCVWEKGSKVREKDPSLITRIYKSSTNPLRSCFNPLPTSQQHKTDDELECIKNNFLKDVQRLHVLEAMKPKKQKKKNATTEQKEFHYLFDLHLEFNYMPYEESKTEIITVIQLCKKFARERKEESLLDPFLIGPFEHPNTAGQSDSPQWHNLRSIFFPSSIGKRIYHMTPKGYKKFLREHLGQMKKFTGNRATEYGTKNEPKARKAYEANLQKKDSSIKIQETGMWSNYEFLELSCSPDGIITRDSGELALIEIKCPLLLRNGNPNTFENNLSSRQIKRFCLERKEEVKLKRDHPYFYQIQLAMGIMEVSVCHFVVWSPKGMFHEEVKFDAAFFGKLKEKMVPLFWKLLVPEYFFNRTPRRMEPCLLHYNIDKLD